MSLFLHASCLVSHKKAFVVQIMVKHTHVVPARTSRQVSCSVHPVMILGSDGIRASDARCGPFPLLCFSSEPLRAQRWSGLFAFALIHIHASGVSSRGGERFNWALDGEVPEWQVEEEVESRCLRHYWPWAAFPLFDSFCVELESLSSKIIREIMEYQFAARVGPLTDAQTHCELMHRIYSNTVGIEKKILDISICKEIKMTLFILFY